MVMDIRDIAPASNSAKDIHRGVFRLLLAFGRMQFITISFGVHMTDLQYEKYER